MPKKQHPRVTISWWLWLIECILVRYVKVSEEWIDSVRKAAASGPVIFILRNRNLINFLCLRGICHRHQLPPLGYVSGISPFSYLPLWKSALALFSRKTRKSQKRRMKTALANGGSAIVFLRRPALRGAAGSRPVALDGIHIAVEVQKELDVDVQALPTVFLWGEDPMQRTAGTTDFLFGTPEYPRLLRSIWLLVKRRSVHGVWAGPATSIASIRKNRVDDTDALTGIVRASVGRQIEQIRILRLGTLKKSSARVKYEVIHSKRLEKELQSIARDEGIPLSEIQPRVTKIVEALATDFKPRVLSLFAGIMKFVWARLYNGFNIQEQDMENIRNAVGNGSLLMLPCHKSHVDYLAVSQAMKSSNIMLPHIAAGDNLDFWPMGPLFRSCGAFFIRRKFVNDRFYTAVVNAYIRRLIHEGYAIEVFIEGGRSRTGKLLRPKLGMLEMALNSMSTIPGRNPGVLPTYIGYENIIEENTYVRESLGKKKRGESIAGLLKASRVLLNRWGQLYVKAGSFFTVQNVLDELGYQRTDLLQGSIRRLVAQSIAMRTLTEINRISLITPHAAIAMVLLSISRSRIKLSTLIEQTIWLVELLQANGAGLTTTTSDWLDDPAGRRNAFLRTLKVFARQGKIKIVKAGDPIVVIRHSHRMHLDFNRNAIIHFLVPMSLVCVACGRRSAENPNENVSLVDITDELVVLYRLYHWEFLLPEYRSGCEDSFRRHVDTEAKKALQSLEQASIVEQINGACRIRDIQSAQFLTAVLRSVHETYHCALYVTRQRVQGEITSDPTSAARRRFDEMLSSGTYIKPEGKNRIQFQTAFSALKDLKLNRPGAGEAPFAPGGLGDRLIRFLERAIENHP